MRIWRRVFILGIFASVAFAGVEAVLGSLGLMLALFGAAVLFCVAAILADQ